MDEPAAGGHDVLTRRQKVADIGEAALRVGLHLAHVEDEVGIGVDERLPIVGRDDADFVYPAERSGIDPGFAGS